MTRARFRYLGPFCLLISATLTAQTFRNPLIIPTGTDPAAVAMADVNRDGHPDLLYVETAPTGGGALHVLAGSGSGTFERTQDVDLPPGVCYQVCYIGLGDINGDGILDVVLDAAPGITGNTGGEGAVAVLLGNGDGTFQAPIVSTFYVGSSTIITGRIGIGDVNEDGAADLLLPDAANGQVDILLGDKTGHFHLGSTISGLSDPIAVKLRDLNSDGHLDLVTLPAIAGTAYVALGKGDGTFAAGTSYTNGFIPPVFYDFDGDGIPDLVFENYDSTNAVYDLVLCKGQPDGTFAAPTPLTVTLPEQLLDAGDYTGNGRADLLINLPAGFGIYPQKSDRTYGAVVQTAAPVFLRSAVGALGDINGDSHPDFAVPMQRAIAVFLGNGDGSFKSADVYDVGHLVNSAALVTFAGSTNVNIAVQQPATFPRLLLGDGTGNFKLAADPNSSYGTAAAPGSLLAGDFNGDGNTDLFETGSSSQTNSFAALFGQPSGGFATPVTQGETAQLIADLNGDGRADLIEVDSTGTTVQLGQANNSFVTETTPPRVSTFAQPVAVGDLNGDGKPDLITSTEAGMDVYLGNGDGTFTFSNQLQPALNFIGYPNYAAAAIADIDGDGKPDLIYMGGFRENIFSTVPQLVVLPGNGDGTFGTPKTFPLQIQYTSLHVSDLNHDGKPDLVLSSSNALAVLMNTGGGFGAEEPLVAGLFVGTPVVGDVNQDGYPDIVVPNANGTTVVVLLNTTGTATQKLLPATLTVSAEPSPYAGPFTVSLTATGQAQPTGSVSFFSDGLTLGLAKFSSGTAAFTYTGTLTSGTHVITAAYSGDGTYVPSSFTVLHAVSDETFSTSTTLTATPAAPLTTQTVRLVAKVTVTAGGPSPLGLLVTFTEGNISLGTAAADATGTAFLDTSILGAGTHNIVASFAGGKVNGDLILSASSSTVTQVTISTVPTLCMLTSSSTTGTAGTVLNFAATVSSATGSPFGGVTFFDGTQSLGTIAITGNQAVFSTASLAKGSHSITAVFNANNIFASSSSAAVPVSLQAAPRSLIPTLTIVQTQSMVDGRAQLIATVSPAAAGGNITFLADGVILGSGPVNADGVSQISGFAANGSVHNITASVTPLAAYAPSASPTLRDGWMAKAPDFALSLDTQSIAVTPLKSNQLQLSAIGLGQMTGTIGLSCAVPEGGEYTCSFGSPELAYGATTTVTITADSTARAASTEPRVYLACAAFCVMLLPMSKRRKLGFLIFITALVSTALVGCGSASMDAKGTPAVLRIEATSVASPMTVRSIEVFINP